MRALLSLAIFLSTLALLPVAISNRGEARATEYVPEEPITEDIVTSWKVTRATGRRTITLAWPIPRTCVGLPEPEVLDVETRFGAERRNGKFRTVITISVRTYAGPGYLCAHGGMSKRIRLARPLARVLLFDGSSMPPHREQVPDHFSPLKIV
jgi:hypothetical protein